MLKTCCLLLTAALWIAAPAFAAEGPIDGYANYEKFREQVQVLARSDLVALKSLATSRGGREVYLLTVGRGKTEEKPAMLIVGGVHAPHLAGSELALRTVEHLLRAQGTDKDAAALLDRYTLYVIPRPSPDAGAQFSICIFQFSICNRPGCLHNRRHAVDYRGPPLRIGPGIGPQR